MYSPTPDIIAFTSPFRKALLSPQQIQRLKNGTLLVLEEVGIQFPSHRALEIFADSGAKVDMQRQIVRIPSDLVERTMARAPRSFVLAGREERFDLVLDGNQTYICTAGTGVHVVDLQTRQMRASRQEDLAQIARVADALPMISFLWSTVTSQDHGSSAPVHDCYAMLTNTLKHVRGGTTVDPQLAHHIVEMATVVAGSAENRRKRPPINANICTIAPLAQDKHGIECALIYAEAGIPVSFMAMTTMLSTAPATPLGALVLGDAEVISAMVLIQLAFPGAPVFHSVYVSIMEPRTGAYVSKVPLPLNMMSVELAHAWNVPSLGGARMGSDALDIGWQSGMEATAGAAYLALTNGEICGNIGLLGGAMIFSPEQIILDHEICWTAFELMHGFDFDSYDLALDVIKQVGPRGNFLTEEHTLQHLRDFHLSKLLNRKHKGGGWIDPRDLALEEFKRIDGSHRPQPLPTEVRRELDRILLAADKERAKLLQLGKASGGDHDLLQ
ncbi:MAG: trimethylamine methyltransferase family protein [Desulfobacterales bacterium]|nr:MAG: trimethylamine methyltransferase family protein [Desulfobacterales bacterium]